MKKITAVILTVAIILAMTCTTALAVDETRHYDFDLTANGEHNIKADVGDVIEISFVLRRTDDVEKDKMFAFQNAITWDNTFFNLVEDSTETKSGVRAVNRKQPQNKRDMYVSQLLIGGANWSCENEICSFQLVVIAESGSSTITCKDAYVCTEDGQDVYSQTVYEPTVTVAPSYGVTMSKVADSKDGYTNNQTFDVNLALSASRDVLTSWNDMSLSLTYDSSKLSFVAPTGNFTLADGDENVIFTDDKNGNLTVSLTNGIAKSLSTVNSLNLTFKDIASNLQENANASVTLTSATVTGTVDTSPTKTSGSPVTVVCEPTKVTVTWKSQDGTQTLGTDQINSGNTPSYSGTEPSKPATEDYSYSFVGWAESVNQESAVTLSAITADKTYYAAFSKTQLKYTATFVYQYADGSSAGDNAESSIKYGTEISIPALANHEIVSSDKPDTMPQENTTITVVVSYSACTVSASKYLSLQSQTLWKIDVTLTTALPSGKVPTDGTSPLYETGTANKYTYLVFYDTDDANDEASEIVALESKLIGTVTGTASKYNATNGKATNDVNMTGKVDFNDAQVAYDISTGKYTDFSLADMTRFLNADVNASGNVDVSDAAAIAGAVIAVRSES